jgi:hypothetical protein
MLIVLPTDPPIACATGGSDGVAAMEAVVVIVENACVLDGFVWSWSWSWIPPLRNAIEISFWKNIMVAVFRMNLDRDRPVHYSTLFTSLFFQVLLL